MPANEPNRDRARTAVGEELASLLHHHAPDVLLSLLDNPALEETQLCVLLDRKDLPTEVLEEVARRKPLLRNYRVKRALAFHPRTPRLASLRLIRELNMMDFVQFTIIAGIYARLKLNAARRGTALVSASLLAEGHAQVLSVVLDNPGLTEAQVLKALSRESLPVGVVKAVAQHRKWSHTYNVRLALVRHPSSTLSTILAYLPELTVSDLRELAAPGIVSENLRKYLLAEIQQRIGKGEKSVTNADTNGETGTSKSK